MGRLSITLVHQCWRGLERIISLERTWENRMAWGPTCPVQPGKQNQGREVKFSSRRGVTLTGWRWHGLPWRCSDNEDGCGVYLDGMGEHGTEKTQASGRTSG